MDLGGADLDMLALQLTAALDGPLLLYLSASDLTRRPPGRRTDRGQLAGPGPAPMPASSPITRSRPGRPCISIFPHGSDSHGRQVRTRPERCGSGVFQCPRISSEGCRRSAAASPWSLLQPRSALVQPLAIVRGARLVRMKEDVLEQIVDDYLQMQGYFTTHNVRLNPPKDEYYVTRDDSVSSDIDVVGLHPRRTGADRVMVVSCKSWQSGYAATRILAQLRGEAKNPKRRYRPDMDAVTVQTAE
jgi:hypothetical protein